MSALGICAGQSGPGLDPARRTLTDLWSNELNRRCFCRLLNRQIYDPMDHHPVASGTANHIDHHERI
jgi:hypothetical protein